MTQFTAYTDGACSGNPGPGGWAFLLTEDGKITYEQANPSASDATTNNQMEMVAIIQCLEYLLSEHTKGFSVAIHTDSNNTIQTMSSWVHSWKKNGWKRPKDQEIKNLALIQTLYRLCFESDITVTWVKVKAHQKPGTKLYDPFNDRVDRLATGEHRL